VAAKAAREPGGLLPGLRLDGQTVPFALPVEKTASGSGVPAVVRNLVDARARAIRERRIRLVVPEVTGSRLVCLLEATLGELGVTVDVDAVASAAWRVGRGGDWLDRARQSRAALRGEVDVPLEPRFDTRVAVERLLAYKEDLDVPPRAARYDVGRRAVVPERAGRVLDADATAAAIARAALAPLAPEELAGAAVSMPADAIEVPLVFAAVAPRVTSESLAHLDASHVLASYATYFSRRGDQGPRAENIEVAASHIDGLVVLPGETVSFNDIVGARSEDNGFRRAYEIFKGEYVEGTGGGTCQVASTLHAIAFFGGLDIVQRLPHSRPSAYIPAGLDATVVYPTVDLRLRNPYAFPLVVHAAVTGNKLAMDLLGASKLASVTFGHEVLATTPYSRRVVEEPTAARPRRKQKGADGMELSRWRTIAFRDGPTRLEKSRDTYPPTDEIWQIPPGYDESQLPPLGEDFARPATD
jgi:vancomycin resistance protein YoaR